MFKKEKGKKKIIKDQFNPYTILRGNSSFKFLKQDDCFDYHNAFQIPVVVPLQLR